MLIKLKIFNVILSQIELITEKNYGEFKTQRRRRRIRTGSFIRSIQITSLSGVMYTFNLVPQIGERFIGCRCLEVKRL